MSVKVKNVDPIKKEPSLEETIGEVMAVCLEAGVTYWIGGKTFKKGTAVCVPRDLGLKLLKIRATSLPTSALMFRYADPSEVLAPEIPQTIEEEIVPSTPVDDSDGVEV